MTVIIDYGMGNLGSIKNMLKKVGHESEISSSPYQIAAASRLVLPGVGFFKRAMDNLHEKKLVEPIQKAAEAGIPLLGVCLGMQLLADHSEEGDCDGLGIIPGKVKKFKLDSSLKVPHMGWNYIKYKSGIQLFKGFEDFNELRYYFVHSYHFDCKNEENSIGKTNYGIEFTSIVNKDRVYGTQFHPEKSHKFGMKLFENFMSL